MTRENAELIIWRATGWTVEQVTLDAMTTAELTAMAGQCIGEKGAVRPSLALDPRPRAITPTRPRKASRTVTAPREEASNEDTRRCRKCEEVLPIGRFRVDNHKTGVRRRECVSCEAAARRARKDRVPQ